MSRARSVIRKNSEIRYLPEWILRRFVLKRASVTVSNVTETLQELLKGFEPVVVDVKDLNEHKAWGNKFIDNFAKDIRIAFPDSKGYSARNLKYMAKFAEIYSDREFVQQVVAQILWG